MLAPTLVLVNNTKNVPLSDLLIEDAIGEETRVAGTGEGDGTRTSHGGRQSGGNDEEKGKEGNNGEHR